MNKPPKVDAGNQAMHNTKKQTEQRKEKKRPPRIGNLANLHVKPSDILDMEADE